MRYIINKNKDIHTEKILRDNSLTDSLSVLYICNYPSGSVFESHFNARFVVRWNAFMASETFGYYFNHNDFQIGRELSGAVLAEEIERKRREGKLERYTITTSRLAKEIMGIMPETVTEKKIQDPDIMDVINAYNKKLRQKNAVDEYGIMQKYYGILDDEKYIMSLVKRYRTVVVYGGEKTDGIQAELIRSLSQRGLTVCVITVPYNVITVHDIEKYQDKMDDIISFCPYREEYETAGACPGELKKMEGSLLRNDMLDKAITDIKAALKNYLPHEIGILTTYADDTVTAYLQKGGINCGRNSASFYQDVLIRGITALLSVNAAEPDIEGIYGYLQVMGVPFSHISKVASDIIDGKNTESRYSFIYEYVKTLPFTESIANTFIRAVEMIADHSVRKAAGRQISKVIRLLREMDCFYREESLYYKTERFKTYILGKESYRREGRIFFDESRIPVFTPFELVGRSGRFRILLVLGATSKNWVRAGGSIFDQNGVKTDMTACYRNLSRIILDHVRDKVLIYSCDINNDGWRNEGNFDEVLESLWNLLNESGKYNET